MTVNFRKKHGLLATSGGVLQQKRASGVPMRGPIFSTSPWSNKLLRSISRCRLVSSKRNGCLAHQELLLDFKHPLPRFVGKLHNDARNAPFGHDTKVKVFLSVSHHFTAKLNDLGHFKSELRNSQKWLESNEEIRDYFRRLQILDHVRERDRP